MKATDKNPAGKLIGFKKLNTNDIRLLWPQIYDIASECFPDEDIVITDFSSNSRNTYAIKNESGTVLAAAVVGRNVILNVCVRKQNRRQGLGRIVISRLLDEICKIYPAAYIQVEEYNTAAKKLYEFVGFRVVSKSVKNGETVLTMRRSCGEDMSPS